MSDRKFMCIVGAACFLAGAILTLLGISKGWL